MNTTDSGDPSVPFSLSWAIRGANILGAGGDIHAATYGGAYNSVVTSYGQQNIIFSLSGSGHDLTLTNSVALIPDLTAPLVTIDGTDDSTGFNVNINKSGPKYVGGIRYLNNTASGGNQFVIENLNFTGLDGSGVSVAQLLDNDKITIDNLQVSGCSAVGISVFDTPSGSTGKITIQNCTIYGNKGGISIFGPAGAPVPTMTSVITNNRIGENASGVNYGNSLGNAGKYGILLAQGVSNFAITNNIKIYAVGGPGVALTSDAGVRNLVSNNPIASVSTTGTNPTFLLPIDINNNGILDDNDPGDGDSGANGQLNHPEILDQGIRKSGTQWTIPFAVNYGTNTGSYTFEFYRRNPTGDREWAFVKSSDQTVSATTTQLSATFIDVTEISQNDVLAVVAIAKFAASNGNTSEFSPSVTAVPVLAGDYNRDGLVDRADYGFWRANFGNTVSPYSGADGNGNGVIDADDYVIWAKVFDPANGFSIADYNHDGVVNVGDYNFWRSTFGNSVGIYTGADGNGNGVIDAGDYVIWRDTFSSRVGAAKFGVLDAAFGPGLPPEAVGFAISNASAGMFDFTAVAGSGEQLRSIPLAGANSISITFNQVVTVSSSALTLLNLDGTAPSIASFSYDTDSQTGTWTFNSALADGRYLVRLADSVQNSSSVVLDGEFTNPWSLSQTESSIFASGDATAGGEFRFRFTILAGDTNHDNIDGTTNYQNWKSYEPGMIHVSTTTDEFDSDLSFGDVSLREAIDYANNATEPTTIDLPAGRYTLSLTGTEATGTAQNDLDVSGNVTILGAGPGLSVVVPGWSQYANYYENHLFSVSGSTARLHIEGVTLTGGYSYTSLLGLAVLAQNQAAVEIVECALVNNTGYGAGVAVKSLGSNVTVLRSVFTNNTGYDGVAIDAAVQGANSGSLTIGESIFALNATWGANPNVKAAGSVAKTNLGKNLIDNSSGGFFNVVAGTGDYLGTASYVVTSVDDTFDHSDDVESLSVRESVDKANATTGVQEIWIPAWKFTLKRDRGSATTDSDASIGDLDVSDSAVVRGVADQTSIAWKAGVVDRVFDLLGDYTHDGVVDSGDYVLWQTQNGSTGAPEQFAADGDDDGDVDSADYSIWSARYGNSLQLYWLTV